MGLSIEVGSYANVLEDGDAEESDAFKRDLQLLDSTLIEAGLRPHSEPEVLASGHYFSCDMLGYGGLHYVRRIGAYLSLGLPCPEPGPDYSARSESKEDKAILKKYYAQFKKGSSFVACRENGSYAPFSHLMQHGDADGIYAPQKFNTIQLFDPEAEMLGTMIGSSHTLLEECRKIAVMLEVPDGLDPESDEFDDEIESQGHGDAKWKRYAIETYGCLQLIRACEASILSGSIILFC
jgi:hypothetical protein